MDVTKFVANFFQAYRASAHGGILEPDGKFLIQTLVDCNAQNCLELGVASGFSSSLMLAAMEEFNPNFKLYAADCAERDFADKSKPTGYLINETNPNPRCYFELHLSHWSGRTKQILGEHKIDVAFVDACHRQPWPLIDAMLILPHLQPSGIIIFHDIHMHENKSRDLAYGIGPHCVYEHVNEEKWESIEPKASIGAVRFQKPIQQYEADFLKISSMPWTIDRKINPAMTKAIFERLSEVYSSDFVAEFKATYDRLNTVSQTA